MRAFIVAQDDALATWLWRGDPMSRILRVYGVTLIAFAICDAVWLGLVASDLYRDGIGHLMASEPNWIAAVLFYLIFIAGLVYFAVLPARSTREAVGRAAFFGFVAYATYDLTNLATLRGWPVGIVVADLAWGAFVSAVGAAAGFAMKRRS
jgi:uncharacterized membrane protein